MDGFIIASGFSGTTGKIKKFLDRKGEWKDKTPDEAFVFTPAETRNMLAKAETEHWKTMPEYFIEAKYDKKTDSTTIVGKIQPTYGVFPINVE